MEERTSEIFRRLQKKQMEVAKEAEEAEHKQEELWREQGELYSCFTYICFYNCELLPNIYVFIVV
jgi:hypothetical protein